MMIIRDSKINVSFGKFEHYYAENLEIFVIVNSSLIFENTDFANFSSTLIYSSTGFIIIDKFNFSNAFVSLSYVNGYVIKLENDVSFVIKNSEFKSLQNFIKVKFFFLNIEIKKLKKKKY